MKAAIVGSRTFNNYKRVKLALAPYVDNIHMIVSGGAQGADKLGERYAEEFNIHKLIFKPDWKTFGKRAGFIRNEQIIRAADIVFAFWDGVSRGTQNSIEWAKKMGKPLVISKFRSKQK